MRSKPVIQKAAEKFYRDAVNVQAKYYTLAVLADYLVEQNLYVEAGPVISQKIKSSDNTMQLPDSISTYRQLAEINNKMMDYSQAKRYNRAIYDYRTEIFSTDNFQMKFSLFEALDNFSNDAAVSEYQITCMKQMIYLNNKLAQNTEDSLLLAAIDRSKYPSIIGRFYDSEKRNTDSATKYFKMAIQTAFSHVLATHDPRYITILKKRYEQYTSARLSKRSKLLYLRKQQHDTKKSELISVEAKHNISQYLSFLIKKIIRQFFALAK